MAAGFPRRQLDHCPDRIFCLYIQQRTASIARKAATDGTEEMSSTVSLVYQKQTR